MLLDIQFASRLLQLPSVAQFNRWVERALDVENKTAEIVLRIVDEAEGKILQQRWCNKAYATNVLAFPVGERLAVAPQLLGDIVICAPIVKREAEIQGKTDEAHWAHLVTHGVLHLQHYDHQLPAAAAIMEAKEQAILKSHGYPDPYSI